MGTTQRPTQSMSYREAFPPADQTPEQAAHEAQARELRRRMEVIANDVHQLAEGVQARETHDNPDDDQTGSPPPINNPAA